jgi:Tetrahydrofolate dehydrogenase/cyclohydrolase, catalytic domain/Tetrahydrofolate dehydrogenase/cyclohydrolase, NAD(P)-binding domain
MKANACRRVGIEPERFALSDSATTDVVLEVINQCNADPEIYGILLQHPVPPQVDERAWFDAIKLAKDVDGVTSLDFGRLALGALGYGSATPAGIMALLAHQIDVASRNAVVIGRSPILGKPMAMMFDAILLRISASHMLIIIHQGSRHDARLRAQQVRNQSGQLVGFYQLPHRLGSLRFHQPIFSHAVELLLGHALAWGIHPTSQNPVAPNALGGKRIGHILRQGCQRPFRRRVRRQVGLPAMGYHRKDVNDAARLAGFDQVSDHPLH